MREPTLMTWNDIKNDALRISDPSFFPTDSASYKQLNILRNNYQIIMDNIDENFDNYLKGENLNSIHDIFNNILQSESEMRKTNEYDYPFSATSYFMGDVAQLVNMNFYLDGSKLPYNEVKQFIEKQEKLKEIQVKFEIDTLRLQQIKNNESNLSKKNKI